ncbi:hypothetical protein C2G38_2327883 [Gigaspora rosea]|uniref:Uncharacterized protein n=1 Tax=Gigaspora rosea TaxID=44941 RepID=A0A397UT18_9GLOM|nr:hypothetical protein C2G38_2327883 [Gigaspora rosea]
MLLKTNFGPYAIENCQYSTSKFRKFTELAAEKARNKPNRNNPNYFKINKTFQNLQKTEKSSELKWNNIHLEILDDKVCIPKQDFLNLVSNIEYLQKNQKDEIFKEITESFETINENIENINENNSYNEYDPIKFKQIIEQNEPKLIGIFDELVEGLIPKTRSSYNQKEAKKSIVSFCYLFAGLRNKFANNYKLDIGLHLASAGTSYKVSSKTVLRFKQQIVENHFIKVSKYFNKNIVVEKIGF